MQKSYQKYADEWQASMNKAFEIVKRNMKKKGESNQQHYNKKVRGSGIDVGDRVLLRNNSARGGTGKLRNHWEETIYVVEEKNPDIPIFTIVPEDGGKRKTVHRNNLTNCNELLPLPTPEEEKKPTKKRKKKKERCKPARNSDTRKVEDEVEVEEAINISESEDEVVVVCHEPEPEGLTEVESEVADNEVDGEVSEEPSDVDAEVEADESDLSDNEAISTPPVTTDDESDNERPQRPQRNRQPPQCLTYDEVGGNPVSRSK